MLHLIMMIESLQPGEILWNQNDSGHLIRTRYFLNAVQCRKFLTMA